MTPKELVLRKYPQAICRRVLSASNEHYVYRVFKKPTDKKLLAGAFTAALAWKFAAHKL